ncbi:unnamed protein product, partial [Effrenium voratum]
MHELLGIHVRLVSLLRQTAQWAATLLNRRTKGWLECRRSQRQRCCQCGTSRRQWSGWRGTASWLGPGLDFGAPPAEVAVGGSAGREIHRRDRSVEHEDVEGGDCGPMCVMLFGLLWQLGGVPTRTQRRRGTATRDDERPSIYK